MTTTQHHYYVGTTPTGPAIFRETDRAPQLIAHQCDTDVTVWAQWMADVVGRSA